jgi:hypothetical protein
MAMDARFKKVTVAGEIETGRDDIFDLDDLLHPAQAFSHPSEVIEDPDLTLNEKRAILASWASDACAVESAPPLRKAHKVAKPVTFDEVMDALRALDKLAGDNTDRHRYRRFVRRRRILGRDRSDDESNRGSSLH